jgi:tetratricopeptide (TPR) repeat protein
MVIKIKQVYLFPFVKPMCKRNLLFLFFTLFLLLMYSSCTTTKNTPMRRAWHNMNARYNGYFLAGEELKENIRLIEKEYKDNYSFLLPVFMYPNKENVKAYTDNFDKSIKRATGVIERHTIITPKTKVEIANACKWIDENYTIIGIAEFYSLELVPALEVFQYVSQKYPDPEAKYRGLLWMMRLYNELGSLSKTEVLIDELKNAKDFPKKKWYKRELALIAADCYIKRGNNQQAIKSLTEAIANTKKKKYKARYNYILAQLYTQTGEYDNAIAAYKKVLKNHPIYEMVFNAKISKANLYAIKDGDSKGVKRELIQMSKDMKNVEYLDQIFYSLALITYKEKDTAATLNYLEKSIDNSTNNVMQKAQAYLKRGDVFFEKQNYITAEINYDSALAVLPEDYPGYLKIKDKKKTLSELVLNLNTIHVQDSLQALSKMSDKEREKAIDKMIAQLEKEEQRKLEEQKVKERIKQENIAAQNTTTTAPPGASAKLWYFYNPNTVSLGVADFTKKWGPRKLEDDWRRSQKESFNTTETDNNNISVDSLNQALSSAIAEANSNIKSREYYLKTIPATNEELIKSDNKIIDAFYNVGVIYKEQLNNNIKSAQAFEELLRRYPENKYKTTVYYYLYRSYLAMNNTDKAEYYKNILLNDYSESEYAKIIRNPDYAKNLMISKNEIEKLYSQTFQLYSSGKYSEALSNCEQAESLYSKNEYMPQFDFIKAMCIGYTQDVEVLEKELNAIIAKHPMHPVKEKAQDILDAMKKMKSSAIASIITNSQQSDSVKGSRFYWVTAVNPLKGDVAKFMEKVELVTQNAFAKQNLNIAKEIFNDSTQLVTIQTFLTIEEAKDYYMFMNNTTQVFSDLEKGTYVTFLIDSVNYPKMQQEKAVDNYLILFNEKIK